MFLERINGMSIGYERIEIVMKTQAAYRLTCVTFRITLEKGVTWDMQYACLSGDLLGWYCEKLC